MSDNQAEIARLGVELAETISGGIVASERGRKAMVQARELLALAKPEEPLPWPRLDEKPRVNDCCGWTNVSVGSGGSYRMVSGLTRAAAIAEWNKVVRAISGGVDEETIDLVRDITNIMRGHGYKHLTARCDDWLARHPKGAGRE